MGGALALGIALWRMSYLQGSRSDFDPTLVDSADCVRRLRVTSLDELFFRDRGKRTYILPTDPYYRTVTWLDKSWVALHLRNAQFLPLDSWKAVSAADAATKAVQKWSATSNMVALDPLQLMLRIYKYEHKLIALRTYFREF
ncbi:hypothetical protein WN51_13246 [Melipona quadrifasciata]|uniref:Uncharacterized protein n=1 Tax=Melipona quadrifasciata TaxID=166423 RepID=A0A0M9A2Z4_9HYME|nr:hypothetical protein WN51_13246 [Melipona quadrifasciata]